ncbi:MAG: selenocysteine-specific translation elongation factor [Thermoleophilia bacterium]|nr:selenocysteine-specific translation elongation factor [Thermoleophilia bacterium]
MPLTVGTAGHVDHGKTWLVRALTGKDTDRLPEEKARGISIDLGYAPLELPGGRRLSLVDVPGHERFVRTMVAGATGIDLFLLVVDAGEGARPQTHEHLAVLRLLGVRTGVVAVTKADAVDPELVELAVEEARELVPGATAVLPVSAKTGAGLDELRSALARAAEHVASTPELVHEPARLYVDRVFTLRGIGTVVTGTLWAGSVGEGDVLRAEPAGIDVRVRSVQVHDRAVERAAAGQRVALALPGVDRQALRRGDALVERGAFRPSYRLDVEFEELEPLPARATVHHGTAAIAARVVRRGRFAQLRLAAPVVAARGDRLVLRTDTTLGGGTVVDPAPPRHADPDRFDRAARGEVTVHAPVRSEDGRWRYSDAWVEELRAELEREIAAADPLDPGVPEPREPWLEEVLPRLGLERRGGKLYHAGATGSLAGREREVAELEEKLGLEPVPVADGRLARLLEEQGRLVRVGDGHAISREAYARARAAVAEECERAGSITLARFRDLLGISRRPAQLLLERLDADGVTRRIGDQRVVRRGARATRY